MNKYKVSITTVDRADFVNKILQWGSKGATLIGVPRLTRIPFYAQLEVLSKSRLKTGNFLGYIVTADHLIYTKQELEDTPIEELRDITKVYGINGRDKVKMIRETLAAQEEYLIANGYVESVKKQTPVNTKQKGADNKPTVADKSTSADNNAPKDEVTKE